MNYGNFPMPSGAISIEEHSKFLGSSLDYVNRLAQDTLMSCFVQWNADEAASWGGPWPGDTVFCTVEDARLRPYYIQNPLITVEEHLRRGEISAVRSTYNFPYRLTKNIDLNMLYGGQPCQRSELTDSEINNILLQMTSEEMDKRYRVLEKSTANRYAERLSYTSVDYPFRLRMCGNDDCSYSRCYASAEEAISALEAMIVNPNFRTLEECGLVFTN